MSKLSWWLVEMFGFSNGVKKRGAREKVEAFFFSLSSPSPRGGGGPSARPFPWRRDVDRRGASVVRSGGSSRRRRGRGGAARADGDDPGEPQAGEGGGERDCRGDGGGRRGRSRGGVAPSLAPSPSPPHNPLHTPTRIITRTTSGSIEPTGASARHRRLPRDFI